MSAETESDSVNVSKLRELAVRGKNYREEHDVEYLNETLTLFLKPLTDLEFLPLAAVLEEKMDIDTDDAREMLEEDREAGETDSIDASNFDREFIVVMSEAALSGIDTTRGDAEGETREGLRQIFGVADDEEENIGLRGGKTLEIAEKVLDISSNAEKAESFRRDGGGQ